MFKIKIINMIELYRDKDPFVYDDQSIISINNEYLAVVHNAHVDVTSYGDMSKKYVYINRGYIKCGKYWHNCMAENGYMIVDTDIEYKNSFLMDKYLEHCLRLEQR